MHSVGIGRTLLLSVAVGVSALACGSTPGGNGGSGGGGGNASSGTGDTGGTGTSAKAGANPGGSESSGAAGKGMSGSAGNSSEVLREADPDEPCEEDPLAAHWIETTVELTGGSNLVVRLGAGGPLAVLVGFGKDSLLTRTSTANGAWTEPTALPGTVGTDYPERIEVSLDGSTALVLWRRRDDQRLFFNLLGADGRFAPAVELDAPLDVESLALPGQRVLFGYGGAQGIQLIEYTPAGGFSLVAPIQTNYSSLCRDAGDRVAVFGTSSVLAEPDQLYPYTFGSGFALAQPITPHSALRSAWQTFFFGFPNGRAARVTRAWQEPETRGLHVTTRQAGSWGAEELVTRFGVDMADVPMLAYAQEHLLLAWKDEDQQVVAVREHDGESWQPPRVLPRSRALQRTEIVGAESMALLSGEQNLKDEQVSVKKLYRRGADGSWYCPRLFPNSSVSELASDGEGFWFAQRMGRELRVWRFNP